MKQTHEQKPDGCVLPQLNSLLYCDSNLSWHWFSNLYLSREGFAEHTYYFYGNALLHIHTWEL